MPKAFALVLICAVSMVAAFGEKVPSEACLHIAAQGSFEQVDWTWMEVWPPQVTSRMYDDYRSFMVLPGLGKYEGADAIREYMLHLSPQNIFVESNGVIMPRSGFGMVQEYERTVIAPNGEATSHTMCSWISMAIFEATANSSMAVEALKVKTMAMLRYEVSLIDMMVHGVKAWFPPEAIMAVGLLRSSPAAAQYTCEVIRSSCPQVWTLNSEHYSDMSGCIEHQINTPILDKHHAWLGRSRACRILHVGFASKNPKHCAHVSTVPMADPTGAIKCQDAEDGGPMYYPPRHYFSDAELEFAKQVGRKYGLYSGEVEGVLPIDDVTSAFDANISSTHTNQALPGRISVYIILATVLLWTNW